MSAVTEQDVMKALRFVVDPEVGLNIVDMGLIYGVDVAADEAVTVRMTLTTKGCPMSQILPEAARQSVQNLTRASAVTVDLVWEPAWSPEKITDEGRKQLQGAH